MKQTGIVLLREVPLFTCKFSCDPKTEVGAAVANLGTRSPAMGRELNTIGSEMINRIAKVNVCFFLL